MMATLVQGLHLGTRGLRCFGRQKGLWIWQGGRVWASTTATNKKPHVTTLEEVPGTRELAREILEKDKSQDRLDLTFEDHNAAFKSKTTAEVLRALLVFQICGIHFIVDNNEKLMKLGQKVLGKRLFGFVMKKTFFGQFVAGEDTVGIAPTIAKMHSFGVKSILDYSVEEDISQEEAEQREMESCVPDMTITPKPLPGVPGTLQEKDFNVEMDRYQAKKEFGDRRRGVTGARTFFYQGEANCEKNLGTFIHCIEAVANTTQLTGFAAIKLTALGRPQLLLQLSEVIARARRYHEEVIGINNQEHFQPVIDSHSTPQSFEAGLEDAGLQTKDTEVKKFLDNMTYDSQGIIHLFDWSKPWAELLEDQFRVPNLKTGKLEPLLAPLSEQESEQFKNMLRRIHTVFQAAKDMDVRVMVDAEQSYFQPAISRITIEMMKKYNTEKAIVFNTYQCYLKEALNNLTTDLEQSERQNFYFGAKLVRGAYMEQERARALSAGYLDPINDTYEDTSDMYHGCLAECMRRIALQKSRGQKEKRLGVMVASHNEDTIRFALQQMEQQGIKPEDKVICFGQLLGMCDQLSFPLGQAGYSVYKYVPYGPVNEVLPYLSRRAHENKGILTKLEKEKTLLRRELRDRILQGRLFYKPEGRYRPV